MKKGDLCFKSDSMEVWYRILPFKKFRQNVKRFTQRIKKTKRPLVLTVNRKPEFVVQDVKSYQQMLNQIDRLECIEGIRRGLTHVERGRVRPAEEVYEALRRQYAIP